MYFLSFETSTKIFSLAVNKDDKVLRYRNLKTALLLEDSIIPTVDRILESAGIKFSQIDGFAIALRQYTSLGRSLIGQVGLEVLNGNLVVPDCR